MAKKKKYTYTVKPGEDQGSIGRKYCVVSWKYLYELNKDAIGDNPDLLQPGTKLTIPMWDSTSGDERIRAKGADPFQYTGGLRYRYPWVPLSMSLTDEAGEKLPDFEEEREVVIRERATGRVLAQTTAKSASDIGLLIPDAQAVNIGIKGFPFRIRGELQIHPDDEAAQGEQAEQDSSHQDEATAKSLFDSLDISTTDI